MSDCPECPVCHSNKDVWLFDTMRKLLYRMVLNNNRFACRKCGVTWRRKWPQDYIDLVKSEKMAGIDIKNSVNGQ